MQHIRAEEGHRIVNGGRRFLPPRVRVVAKFLVRLFDLARVHRIHIHCCRGGLPVHLFGIAHFVRARGGGRKALFRHAVGKFCPVEPHFPSGVRLFGYGIRAARFRYIRALLQFERGFGHLALIHHDDDGDIVRRGACHVGREGEQPFSVHAPDLRTAAILLPIHCVLVERCFHKRGRRPALRGNVDRQTVSHNEGDVPVRIVVRIEGDGIEVVVHARMPYETDVGPLFGARHMDGGVTAEEAVRIHFHRGIEAQRVVGELFARLFDRINVHRIHIHCCRGGLPVHLFGIAHFVRARGGGRKALFRHALGKFFFVEPNFPSSVRLFGYGVRAAHSRCIRTLLQFERGFGQITLIHHDDNGDIVCRGACHVGREGKQPFSVHAPDLRNAAIVLPARRVLVERCFQKRDRRPILRGDRVG